MAMIVIEEKTITSYGCKNAQPQGAVLDQTSVADHVFQVTHEH